MDPRAFLHLAQRLAQSTDPADRRTAISRAYYAAYHVGFDLLISLRFKLERGHGAHEAVQVRLRNSSIQAVISAGARLGRLQNVRVKADYWLQDPHPEIPSTAAAWIAEADRIIRARDAAAADPATRERMTRAIQAYEQRTAGGAR